MHKKELLLLSIVNVFLLLIWWILLVWYNNRSIASLKAPPSLAPTQHTRETSIIDTIHSIQPSVVAITITKDIAFYVDTPDQIYWPGNIAKKTTSLGWWSGIFVSKDGYILTNKHVVQDYNAQYEVVLYDWSIYKVEKIWIDDALDLAILKITDPQNTLSAHKIATKFLPLHSSLALWQFVLLLWNTTSTYPSAVTMGILGWMNKKFTLHGNNTYVWLYQTDAQSNPGNSWWPLVDLRGYVVWITTALVEWEGITFALPLTQEFVDTTLRSIERFGKIVRPLVGIQYTDITSDLQQEHQLSTKQWIYITDVLNNLPAREAGIKVWDVITHINTHPINSTFPFLYQLYTRLPWDDCELQIIRQGKKHTISLTLWGNTQ